MYRKSVIGFIIITLFLATASSVLAQSDWWIKGNRKGADNNASQNVHVGDTIVFGKYKDKFMEWLVLEKKQESVLLFSKQSLYKEPYNTVRSKFTTWKDCTLRKKLNDFYLSKAFSNTQRDRIQLTLVDNSSEQHRDIYGKIEGQPNTDDYVFLLSWQEVAKYLPTEESRKKAGIGGWWTRSPGEYPGAALSIGNDGIMTYGNDASSNEDDIYPALWLNLK